MKIRGKACKNGETGVKAYRKFQPSGILGKLVITISIWKVPAIGHLGGTWSGKLSMSLLISSV
jgi:hypothetical protein